MVKLRGPGMSVHASGTLADVLTFGNLRGKPTLRKKPTPAQPRTGLQVSSRAMMQFLAQNWSGLTTPQQATWLDLADNTDVAPYHAFIAHNMQRWARQALPSKAYPAAEAGDYATGIALNGDPGVRHFALDARLLVDAKDTWTGLMFHDTADFPTFTVDKLVHVFKLEDLDRHYWTHQPLAAGMHYYKIWMGTNTGLGPSPAAALESGNVT